MNTDLRCRYTRQVIQSAFWNLLREKPLEKITVKEVCTLACINRSTFYRHYLDCYDLMEKLQQEQLAAFEQLINGSSGTGIRQGIIAILKKIQNEEGVYLLLRSGVQSDNFLRQLVRCCYRNAELHLKDLPALEWEGDNRRFNDCFLISGSMGIIEYWVDTGMKEIPEEIADQILRLAEALLRGLQA